MFQKNNKLDALQAENRLDYIRSLVKTNLRSPKARLITALYWFVVAVLLLAVPTGSLLERLFSPLLRIAILLGGVCLYLIGLVVSSLPSGAIRVPHGFQRAGLVNAAEEPPLVTKRTQDGDTTILEVFTQGIPLSEFEENAAAIESALESRISKIVEAGDNQHIQLFLRPGSTKLPEKIPLPKDFPRKPSQVLLGESLDGPVALDFNKTPHVLIAGSTGSGKTSLIKSVMYQLLNKRGPDGKPLTGLTLIDLKGGQDYPPSWRGHICSFGYDAQDALSLLSMAADELQRRMGMFQTASDNYGVSCSSLDRFNELCPSAKLRREVIVVDELAELTDTTGMDKPHKECAAIMAKLAMIARLGRAHGINLVLGLQRPDAAVLPGQIKNNIDYRVIGKADAVLSQIVLDNTDAATRIPKDSQGLFLNQDDTLFRAYYVDL